ncbi:LPS export ABC transporter periplasmic protein LptC [Hyunsoonleella flava]|uniref:LPS export ABC transporter periplasmic protein LptC n=1 Tax=Hyunsoonleella flava TaxID=2527939 RepID=A0A4Q9FDH2_9FLAO|nr:LPS export ABC transporter periplasmic protein LptC [Hyunsoonleella flava]TBN02689.1 LPS export ABC transporter periplasmic protein LptC [Hyunsoonleella flava]
MVICNSYQQLFAIGLFLIMLTSCTNNLKDVQNIGISDNEPIGVAENINLKYTDSGKVKAILKSPKMYDYSNMKFAYNEFTDGVNLELFEDGKKSVVISDYAIIYNKTNIIDLQGNVKITTHSNDTLFAEQLYYDQEKNWLFTNKPVTFRTGQDIINGNGFDSNSKFTNAEVLEITGLITVDE